MTQRALDSRPNLLLAAFPPELARLLQDPPIGWRVACTGIGVVAAAIATTRLIAEHRPARILFIGTCGAYDGRLGIGDLVSVSEAMAVSLEELEGRAYRPSAECTRWAATLALPFPPCRVAVPPAITRTEEGARLLGAKALVEHLELTGVFAAAHEAKTPVGAVLAVANRVGPQAHAEWMAHHEAASRQLIRSLEEQDVFQILACD